MHLASHQWENMQDDYHFHQAVMVCFSGAVTRWQPKSEGDELFR